MPVTFSFEEVPLDSLRDKPRPKEPSPRQQRIQREVESVQETIKTAKADRKGYRVQLGDFKPATFRLRFAAAKKALGRGYEKINLVTRNGEFYIGPLERTRRGGRRRKTTEV